MMTGKVAIVVVVCCVGLFGFSVASAEAAGVPMMVNVSGGVSSMAAQLQHMLSGPVLLFFGLIAVKVAFEWVGRATLAPTVNDRTYEDWEAEYELNETFAALGWENEEEDEKPRKRRRKGM